MIVKMEVGAKVEVLKNLGTNSTFATQETATSKGEIVAIKSIFYPYLYAVLRADGKEVLATGAQVRVVQDE
jgi:hypothetical protein